MSTGQARLSSIVGMVSALIWLVALTIEYAYGLLPPGDGSVLYYVDQAFFFVALAGYVIMLLGLWQSRAAGNGSLAKIALGLFVAGLAAILVATLVQWLTRNPDFFLYPVGGLFQLLGGLLTGVAVVRADRWEGWQRFAPLTQGLYFLVMLVLSLVIAGQGPSQLAEALWQVTWFAMSLALYTMTSETVNNRRVS
jgi:hypothetical protein